MKTYYNKTLIDIFHRVQLLKVGLAAFLWRINLLEEKDLKPLAEQRLANYRRASDEAKRYILKYVADIEAMDKEIERLWQQARTPVKQGPEKALEELAVQAQDLKMGYE